MTERLPRALLPRALIDPLAYPHPVDEVQLIETHLSWVFLTGTYAYKVKKPVRFNFVDFTSLADREAYCRVELELNRRFAPDLYVDVVPICERAGGLAVNEEREAAPVEWAVRMHQFDPGLTADHLLERSELHIDEVRDFARRIAGQHGELPTVADHRDATQPMFANFDAIRDLACGRKHRPLLEALETWTRAECDRLAAAMKQRAAYALRECHGDLHLGNIVRTDAGLTAFDCLEFDPALREIDVCSDVAFLFMDLAVRERADLAYAFIDDYLDVSADYQALPLLNLYAVYRCLVRAKVTALRLEQERSVQGEQHLEELLTWARSRTRTRAGRLVLTCGVSGSGKSHWARKLVPELGALRLRSDVLRKAQAGLSATARTQSEIDGGIYSASRTEQVYDALADLAGRLLSMGERVIVDATNLEGTQRSKFYEVARAHESPVVVLQFTAPDAVLRKRIRDRERSGDDPSEAGEAVLDTQLASMQPVAPEEPVLSLDTTTLTLDSLLEQIDERFDAGVS